MAELLAIISGKGGSGKTTLAISLSQMLASCGKKVLLVDCDMSTHGATYFFESFMTENGSYCTLIEIISNYYSNANVFPTALEVAQNIQFIPSGVNYTKSSKDKKKDTEYKWDLLHESLAKFESDIVIFDCQAGYSMATEYITSISSIVLSVLEADAISASSLRVLYAQLYDQLDRRKAYQVFNKVTSEEQELYSKLTSGTIFPNLTPVLFDWNVRKAFLYCEMPEIDASNPVFANSVYELAYSLFPLFRNDLRRYILGIKEKMLEALRQKHDECEKIHRREMTKFIITRIIPVALIIMQVFISKFLTVSLQNIDTFLLSGIMIALAFGLIIVLDKQKNNPDPKFRSELKNEYMRLEEEVTNLSKKLNA